MRRQRERDHFALCSFIFVSPSSTKNLLALPPFSSLFFCRCFSSFSVRTYVVCSCSPSSVSCPRKTNRGPWKITNFDFKKSLFLRSRSSGIIFLSLHLGPKGGNERAIPRFPFPLLLFFFYIRLSQKTALMDGCVCVKERNENCVDLGLDRSGFSFCFLLSVFCLCLSALFLPSPLIGKERKGYFTAVKKKRKG